MNLERWAGDWRTLCNVFKDVYDHKYIHVVKTKKGGGEK